MQADPALVAGIATRRTALAAVEDEVIFVGDLQAGECFFTEAVSERVVFFLGGVVGLAAFLAQGARQALRQNAE